MDYLVELLIPLGVCVVLPVMIVWLVTRVKSKSIDKKTDVLMRALENGQEVDTSLLIEKKGGVPKNIKMELLQKLQVAVVFSVLGIALIVLSVTGVMGDNAGVGFPVFLLCGVIFAAIGIGNAVSYAIGNRSLKEEMTAELERMRLENKEKEQSL
ncbi:MAG: DUF6249 domain-containing protein [Candidatus Cryptobacteroides sp.]